MQKVIPQDSVLIPDSAERVFEGMIFDVYQWQQTMFDGSSETFEMLKRPDTVTAICVVDGKILIIDDEQPHTGSRKSFPGGRVDASDRSAEEAAKREVLEETGYSFANWRLVNVRQPYTKIEWFVSVFLAWDVSGKQESTPDIGEKITLHTYSLDELKVLVANKSSSLGDSTNQIKDLTSLEELLALPEFKGRTIKE